MEDEGLLSDVRIHHVAVRFLSFYNKGLLRPPFFRSQVPGKLTSQAQLGLDRGNCDKRGGGN